MGQVFEKNERQKNGTQMPVEYWPINRKRKKRAKARGGSNQTRRQSGREIAISISREEGREFRGRRGENRFSFSGAKVQKKDQIT